MRRRYEAWGYRLAAVLALLIAVAAFPAAAGHAADPGNDRLDSGARFSAGVDLVALNVTVTDGRHQFISDLKPDEIVVFENGLRQDLELFTREQLPVDLSILIDTSSSMLQTLPTAQKAAIGFVRSLRPQDRAEIVAFNSTVRVLQAFTSDHAALEAAVGSTQASGETALYNALYISLKQHTANLRVDRGEGRMELRRRAIVVLSDGEDTRSALAADDVADVAKRSDVTIYTINLRHDAGEDPVAPDPMTGYKSSDFWMQQFAKQSGGRAFTARIAADLLGVYGQIATELSNQYAVGYVPKTGAGGEWRAIRVQVLRPDAIPRTRAGYFAAAVRQAFGGK